MHNAGALIEYSRNLTENFPSLGGYRLAGTGFSPEGFVFSGNDLTIKGMYDLDLIVVNSKTAFKIMANLGAQFHLDPVFIEYSEYLAGVGISYSTGTTDFFIEYSLKAFFNKGTDPKKFSFDWGWGNTKIWEVAFTENPAYLTIGGRINYPRGLILYAAVPLLLSTNKGSDITYGGNTNKLQAVFPDEKERGITDPFDPWYAKWKVVAGMSYSIRYRQTSSELKRAFLLMKNSTDRKKIDIDQKLNLMDTPVEESDDSDKRLKAIEERRKALEADGVKE